MRLDLHEIVNTPGASKDFRCTFDFSDLFFDSVQAFEGPVLMEGCIRNTAGLLVLSAQLQTTLLCQCARCASSFSNLICIPVEITLAETLEDDENPDIWLLDNDCLELEDVARTVFVLNLDSRFLCREDCKGLCPRCGKNLNDGPCSCSAEVDPRLAVLAQLLKDNQEE